MRSDCVGVKRLKNPQVGPITLEYSAFAVGAAEGLSIIVFTPSHPADLRAIEMLLARNTQAA
jgi:hypothetical protein